MLIQLGLTEIFRVLRSGALKPESPNFIRLFNALARLNREALGLRKYNDLRADKAAAQVQATIKVPSVEEAQHSIFRAFDHAMGLKPAPGPIGPDLNKYLGLDDPPDCSRPGVQIPSPRGEGKGEGELPSSKPATFNLAAPSPDGQSGSDGEGRPVLQRASPTSIVLS